jgi:hypothetical protein
VIGSLKYFDSQLTPSRPRRFPVNSARFCFGETVHRSGVPRSFPPAITSKYPLGTPFSARPNGPSDRPHLARRNATETVPDRKASGVRAGGSSHGHTVPRSHVPTLPGVQWSEEPRNRATAAPEDPFLTLRASAMLRLPAPSMQRCLRCDSRRASESPAANQAIDLACCLDPSPMKGQTFEKWLAGKATIANFRRRGGADVGSKRE